MVWHFIDFPLKPLVYKLPSYITDTTYALNRIKCLYMDKDTWMVTTDVKSLYTSIKHTDVLTALRLFLTTSDPTGIYFNTQMYLILRTDFICKPKASHWATWR